MLKCLSQIPLNDEMMYFSIPAKFLLGVSLFVILTSLKSQKDKHTIESPDGKVKLELTLVDQRLVYQLKWSGQEMVKQSQLALFPDSEISIINTKKLTSNTTWKPVWGQFSSIQNHYTELELDIQTGPVKGKLLARVYDQGVAFRFVLPKGKKPNNAEMLFSVAMREGNRFYAPNGEGEPLGPSSLDELSRFELSKSKNNPKASLAVPLVVETPGHQFMALLESDLYAANGMKSMQIGVDMAKRNIVSSNSVALSDDEFTSPWRVILLGKTAGELVTNTMTQNLATECQIQNTDWIKPGKTLWDWRVHGYTAPDGFTYGINTESYLRFIDFAAENGIDYFLIDDAWYTKASQGQFEMSPKLDLQKVINHAKEKEVALLLYYDNRHGVYGDSALFPYYQSLGMKGIKYGFMGANVPFTKNAIRQSAASQLLIDFHDGPVPYSEAARTLIIFSGLVCIPDAPEAYAAKQDLFEFIQKQPVGKWDETRILNATMDAHITTARRHGKEWFIGSVVNQKGGILDINLDFLEPDKTYAVTFYEDTDDTHCATNPESYQIRKGTVTKGSIIKAKLAPGGGHCMWIRPSEN